jgi:TonB family protein
MGAPRALGWTAEALSLIASRRAGDRSTGELGDPSRITIRPEILNEARMRRTWRSLYPDSLTSRGVEGEVVASFIVNTDGSVDPASIHMVSVSHPLFRDPTALGVLELRFSPARQRGRPVRVRVQLPIRWRLSGW